MNDISPNKIPLNKSQNDNWVVWLKSRIAEFRIINPNDERSDTELCESLMDHYVRSGLIKKKNGKYQLPRILYD